ncbi:hypothetical protein TYRP_018466 [Tyrophagus putrescentiae]|nr:hypothetical protein TYRP_018466 [Tyrophagus putrescentiae]
MGGGHFGGPNMYPQPYGPYANRMGGNPAMSMGGHPPMGPQHPSSSSYDHYGGNGRGGDDPYGGGASSQFSSASSSQIGGHHHHHQNTQPYFRSAHHGNAHDQLSYISAEKSAASMATVANFPVPLGISSSSNSNNNTAQSSNQARAKVKRYRSGSGRDKSSQDSMLSGSASFSQQQGALLTQQGGGGGGGGGGGSGYLTNSASASQQSLMHGGSGAGSSHQNLYFSQSLSQDLSQDPYNFEELKSQADGFLSQDSSYQGDQGRSGGGGAAISTWPRSPRPAPRSHTARSTRSSPTEFRINLGFLRFFASMAHKLPEFSPASPSHTLSPFSHYLSRCDCPQFVFSMHLSPPPRTLFSSAKLFLL